MVFLVGAVEDNPGSFAHHFFVWPPDETVLAPLVLQRSVAMTSPVPASYVTRLYTAAQRGSSYRPSAVKRLAFLEYFLKMRTE